MELLWRSYWRHWGIIWWSWNSWYPIGGAQSSVSETKNEGDLGSRANQGGNSYKQSNYNTSCGGGGGAGADGNAGSVNYPNGGNGGDGYASDITGTSYLCWWWRWWLWRL